MEQRRTARGGREGGKESDDKRTAGDASFSAAIGTEEGRRRPAQSRLADGHEMIKAVVSGLDGSLQH